MTTLSLRRNRLSGRIPSLSSLDLSRNQLSGEIPHQIVELSLLESLDLSNNQISGEIPRQIGELSRLRPLFIPSITPLTVTARIDPDPVVGDIHSDGGITNFVHDQRLYRRKKRQNGLSTWELTPFQFLHFTENQILSSLVDNNLIGSGGSGKVYRVCVNNPDSELLAVKKIWSKGSLLKEKEKEFDTEMQILGNIRHNNIVKLLCCISCEKSKLLVYEYMVNCSLDRWLHGKRRRSSEPFSRSNSVGNHLFLDWPTRLQIAVGAAQGLCYMHHGCSPPVIHRDIKTSNILLDSEFNAKIADFGLAKMLAKGGEPQTMSSIAGSFGYFAPEYAYTTKVNEKIDIYSFRVVLLELVTGKKANYGDENTCLAEWAWRHIQDEKPIVDALDEEVKEPCHIDGMSMVFKMGLICTGTLPSTRPSMKEVLQLLQQSALKHVRSYLGQGDGAPN
ncbi:hypothetical protein Sjap_011573 [Stephania japonica]|uniref:Protein kinase domain-containing protein n=1 Tax=Stephania japonica TaxID=461633 RepID=A0AAP0JDF7_9MAGN